MAASDEIIELKSGAARASIALMGAEWRAWSVAGHPLLWSPDPAFWSQTAPVLFPVCGWTREGQVRVGGKSYPLGLHGFASRMVFDVVARGADFVRLVLRDDDDTRSLYPFAFELEIEYQLDEASLEVRTQVRNRGGEIMPYALGLHPGFRWPFVGGAREAYAVVFDKPERGEVPVIAPGGLFSPEWRAVRLDGARLPLSEQTFTREALCFLDAYSTGLRFEGPGGCAIRVETEDYPHIVLWSRPGAPFLCVESWTGYGDPVGFGGELVDKPSMIPLPAARQRAHRASYHFEIGGSRKS